MVLLGNSPGKERGAQAQHRRRRHSPAVLIQHSAGLTAMKKEVSFFFLSPSASPSLPGCIALLIMLQVHRLVAAQFRVIAPDRPVVASVGEVAVLPCRLSPATSAESMEVRWVRSRFSPYVHLYSDSQDQPGEQMPEYVGRTQLLKENITSGSVSLRIRGVRPSDHGQYTCFFQAGVSSAEALLELHVTALGSDPQISAEGHQDGGIRLVCRSAGWYPEPEVQWRDHRGQPLPKTSEKISADTEGLFHAEVAVVIVEESNQIVTCSVRNLFLNQEKTASISIAGHFFPRVSPWMVALAVIVPIVLVVIVLGSFYFRRAKEKYKAVKEKYVAVEEKYVAVEEKYKAVEELGLTKAQRHAADVTLDPGTAHPQLVLSEDRRCVRLGDTRQDVPDTPERFDPCACVLGAEGFAGGRRYWEVEVGDKTRWVLGVCRESVPRKGWVTLSPCNGYWVVQLGAGGYQALTSSPTRLSMSVRPRRVGVFLDYDGGEVSFYNVTDRSHLFTFTDSFSGTLRPYFHPGVNAGGTNAAPLTLCPAPAQP